MTLPFPVTNRQSYVAQRANWLGRYLAVEKEADKQLFDALVEATKGIDETLLSLKGKHGQDAAVRRMQFALAHKEIRNQMESLFGNVEYLIKDYHGRAASAAVDAALHSEKHLLAKLFSDKVSQEAYAASLRQTARRNIDAVMTRVLETEIPLSKRVWRTRALSQGMVDRAINNALARGDSFEDLARAVHHLVDPATPGGVTYAAKRLARTEINNAFHAQSIHDAQEVPWVQKMRWNLSKVHVTDPGDLCEDYALQGIFPVEKVPPKPHPHCRCFVTPEPVTDDEFDFAVMSGQYDDYLDEFIGGGTGPLEMEPSPPEPSTTKASQPAGWTGPLVAKSAANKDVRSVQDRLWLKYTDQPGGEGGGGQFRQIVREGSRTVQVKGYKGGLSSPGKKAMLEQSENLVIDESMAFDLGREMTARVAYANPTDEILYRSMQVRPGDIGDLTSGNFDVSLPLTTFDTNLNSAIGNEIPLRITSGNTERVVFQVGPGSKAAEVGDRRVSLGTYKVTSVVKRNEPTGGHYWVANLEQLDAREFNADTPRGNSIADLEFVDRAPDAGSSSVTTITEKATKKVAEPERPTVVERTVATRIREADSVAEIADILRIDHHLEVNGWTEDALDLMSAQEIGLALDERLTKEPLGAKSLDAVDVWEDKKMGAAYAHIQPGWNGKSRLRLNRKYTSSYDEMVASKDRAASIRWTVQNAKDRPWHSTITHEYGHVLDLIATDFQLHSELNAVLQREYVKAFPDVYNESYNFNALPLKTRQSLVTDWLQGSTRIQHDVYDGAGPSRYAVYKANKWGYHPHEMVAEAYADTERNGAQATPVSKAVHAWLKRKIKRATTNPLF